MRDVTEEEVERMVKILSDDLERSVFHVDPTPLLCTEVSLKRDDLSIKEMEESMDKLKTAAKECETPIFEGPPIPKHGIDLPCALLPKPRPDQLTTFFGHEPPLPLKAFSPWDIRVAMLKLPTFPIVAPADKIGFFGKVPRAPWRDDSYLPKARLERASFSLETKEIKGDLESDERLPPLKKKY